MIFELFDFNEIESLSITDLEYLLECCIISSCKLHNLSLEVFNSAELAEYIADTFDDEKRITFPQMLKYCATDPNIGSFLHFFKISDVERKYVARIDRLLSSTAENLLNPESSLAHACTRKPIRIHYA